MEQGRNTGIVFLLVYFLFLLLSILIIGPSLNLNVGKKSIQKDAC